MANTSTNTAKGHASNVVWKSFDYILDIRNLKVKSELTEVLLGCLIFS